MLDKSWVKNFMKYPNWSKLDAQDTLINHPYNLSYMADVVNLQAPRDVGIFLNEMSKVERVPKRGRPRGRYQHRKCPSLKASTEEIEKPIIKLFGCPYCTYVAKYAYSVYSHVRKQHNGKKVYCIDFPTQE
jgi:hypothetical protein